MLSVFMLIVVVLNFIMQNVIMLSVIMPNVAALMCANVKDDNGGNSDYFPIIIKPILEREDRQSQNAIRSPQL